MIAIGLLAGAAGTAALDLAAYLDMFARGRPASTVPGDVLKRMASRAGIAALADDGEAPAHRRSAGGALLGYGVGLGAAVVYAAVRPACARLVPWPIAGVVLGLATLVVSEGTAARLGATDPASWSATDWLSDLLPRSLYGLTVAYVVERLIDGDVTFDPADMLVTARIAAVESSGVVVPDALPLLDEGSVSTTSP